MVSPLRVSAIAGVAVAAVAATTGVLTGPSRAEEQRSQEFRDGAARSMLGSYSSAHPGRGHRDEAWLRAHDAEALAYARLACDWLHVQPDAPEVDPTEHSGYGTLARQFDRSYRDARPAGLSALGSRQLRSAAWAFVCRDDLEQKTSPQILGDD